MWASIWPLPSIIPQLPFIAQGNEHMLLVYFVFPTSTYVICAYKVKTGGACRHSASLQLWPRRSDSPFPLQHLPFLSDPSQSWLSALPGHSLPIHSQLLMLCFLLSVARIPTWGGSDEDPFPHEAGQTFQVDRQELK